MTTCMSEGRSLYRLDDQKKSPGCFPVKSWKEADEWNEKHWGIFWTVNQFNGPRGNANIQRVLAWSVDIDLGTKAEQRALLRKYPRPSAVIETKRGYQVYWDAIDGKPENYNEIQSRLVFAFNGDPNAKDLSRILRVPGYVHWKDVKDPFGIKGVYFCDQKYTEEIMLHFFKAEPKSEAYTKTRKEMSFIEDGKLFDRIYSMDCEQALLRLSGHWSVAMESFSFKRVSSGNLNLYVNGKPTSVFIDKHKRIGSSSGGGPTVWNFVHWYLKDQKKTYQAMKEVFPEVFHD